MDYHVLAFYHLVPLSDPEAVIKAHKDFLSELDARARIYISEEGINAQMSASPEASVLYQAWLREDPRFKDVEFKIHTHHEHPFPRLIIKYRKQLVAMDTKVDLTKRGQHISPKQWREKLENRGNNTLVIDVRNRYESLVGYFEDSEKPQVDTFREFVGYTEDLKSKIDPKNTTILMCCTGGIRCEYYSAHMKKEGFEEVYQLQGGLIKYGFEEGNKHFKGKLFVFDDRMVVPLSDDPTECVGKCKFCQGPSDLYFNCASMDCNELFLACPECAEKEKGCCCIDCQNAPRVRPYDKENGAKPFKRAHFYPTLRK